MTLKRIASKVKKILSTDELPVATTTHSSQTAFLQEFADPQAEIRAIYRHRLDHITPVRQTLLLVSQVQRSGGTLMSQLFDHHPQLHTHPHELYIGRPEKWHYPDLDLTDTPDQWFKNIFEYPTLRLVRDGYQKFPGSATYDQSDIFPFLLLPNLQREIFLKCVREWFPQEKTRRAIIDAYMTSYFNAWVDYQGLYQPKKFITAFVPRLGTYQDSVERYFRDYPDAKLVQVIREPKGWYVSSHKKGPKNYPNPQASMPAWIDSANAILRNKQAYPDRVFVFSFDSLLKDTEGVMRKLAPWLGIDWHDTLTEPTFQGQPIKANTSFSTAEYGVISTPLERSKGASEEDAREIEALVGDLYPRVLEVADA